MFLEVGETHRPRFAPVYSAILGGGYSSLHFTAPLSPHACFLFLNLATVHLCCPSVSPVASVRITSQSPS